MRLWPFKKKPLYQVVLRKEYSVWSEEDSQKLSFFLKSSTGRKFRYIQEQSIHDMTLKTSPRDSFTDGIRVGKALILEEMDSLSRIESEPEIDSSYNLNLDSSEYIKSV